MTEKAQNGITIKTGLQWLAPLIALLLLRAYYQSKEQPILETLAKISDAQIVTSPEQAIWAASKPFILTILIGAALIYITINAIKKSNKKLGTKRTRQITITIWYIALAITATGLTAGHINLMQRQAPQQITAKILLTGQVATSSNKVGGTWLYIQTPQNKQQKLYISPQLPPEIKETKQITIKIQKGKWWGQWAQTDIQNQTQTN